MSLATIRIFLYPYSKNNWYMLGDDIKGEIVIRPVTDLEVIHLGFNFGIEDRGKVTSSYLGLVSKYLTSHTTLNKGEEYKFEFSLNNENYVTYKGINLSYAIKLEAFIVHKPTHAEDANFFSRIKTKLTNESTIQQIKYLNFSDSRNHFGFQTKKIELKPRFKFIKIIFIIPFVIFFFAFFVSSKVNSEYLFWVMGILVGIFGLIVAVYFLIYKSLGRIQVNLEQSTKGKFSALIMNDNNWRQINQLKPEFTITEEVVDNRGTSSTTLRKQIHQELAEKSKYPRGTQKAHFNFPANFPHSMSIGDTKIIWHLNLGVKTSIGLIINYRSEIEVKRSPLERIDAPTKQ